MSLGRKEFMSYIDIVKHYEQCYRIFGDNHKGVDWPKLEDVNTRYQVMLEVIKFDSKCKERPTVLDFGCGLGHMLEYINKQNINVQYEGCDISKVFIKRCKEKYPDYYFVTKDILKDDNQNFEKQYDYIVLNGVLTEKRELSYEEMFCYFKKLIKKLYSSCNHGIAFNVMSKDVDWEREDLFHLSLDQLSNFLTKEVSRNFIIRNDYGLYEYTTYLYK